MSGKMMSGRRMNLQMDERHIILTPGNALNSEYAWWYFHRYATSNPVAVH